MIGIMAFVLPPPQVSAQSDIPEIYDMADVNVQDQVAEVTADVYTLHTVADVDTEVSTAYAVSDGTDHSGKILIYQVPDNNRAAVHWQTLPASHGLDSDYDTYTHMPRHKIYNTCRRE